MVTNEVEKSRQVTLLHHIFSFKHVGKDATIPDQAALRTAVAQKVLEQVGSPSLAGSGVCNFPAKQRLLLAKVPSTERLSYEVPQPVAAATAAVVVVVVVVGSGIGSNSRSLVLLRGRENLREAAINRGKLWGFPHVFFF